MNLFRDSSVAVAASLSTTGASREIFHHAARQGWCLLISPWVLREVRDNHLSERFVGAMRRRRISEAR